MLLSTPHAQVPSSAPRSAGAGRWVEIRRDFHAHPELGFQEDRTSALVASVLEEMDVEVHRSVGGTGVVGIIRKGSAGRRIALRAEMDALPIEEANVFAHRSCRAGRMHACGHDGHIVMLLAAAERLVQADSFDGTVILVFQPAEEGLGGANAMIADGLFERFPVEAIFGMHNWPGLCAGAFGVLSGPVMASCDHFDIHIEGVSAHAALPQNAVDPILVASQLVQEIQAIVSREISPLDTAVVSVTRIKGGDAYNVVPSQASVGGTVRTHSPEVRSFVEAALARLCRGKQESSRATVSLDYRRDYPPTINSAAYAEVCRAAAVDVAGTDNVFSNLQPSMAAEDFSSMLQENPGCYVWIGNGPADEGRFLHGDAYDFNDEIIEAGARYWVRLVERLLSRYPTPCPSTMEKNMSEDLTPRERELVALGAAIGSNCAPCCEHHIPLARKAGLSDAQIATALRLADRVRQVPARKALDVALSAVGQQDTLANDEVTRTACYQRTLGDDQKAAPAAKICG